ncbi:dihydrodipicolinate synthase family protein [Oceanispirochaeta sp.]|jgi:dihydrodipicolinate synthase/N-acetylneuraminate lyase|uniref:dihydrodipicolinate synthase family protein n=1 Tax=Oceanispirochaeta sp. TaxID=2035350 RepID=UPI002635C708|nr:dihydrodipicolinate synthase family protein [Oceanispirochaeta sp.]MDA3955136.1 dihydrodipicolinate synthase family protein [Oceanispirochaeta sp.]
MSKEIKGILPIAPAVYNNKGQVDYEDYASALSCMFDEGSHGITLFGIAGEYYKLSYEEELKLIDVTVESSRKHGKPCIISNTRHSTEVAIEWAKHIEASGADCMMVLPPFFLKPGGASLYEHMKAVGKAVKIPVMVQYAPEQTGVAISPDVLLRLNEECPNIIYYKIECKPPGLYIDNVVKKARPGTEVFVGNAGYQMIEGLDRGAAGVMPGPSMFDVYRSIYDLYMDGKRQEAFKVHKELVYFLNHIRQNVEMIIAFEKKVMKKRGFIKSDYCRSPGFTSDKIFDDTFEELYEVISEYFTV